MLSMARTPNPLELPTTQNGFENPVAHCTRCKYSSHPMHSLQIISIYPQSDTEVQMLVAVLNDALSENDEACMKLKAQYDAFSYLWLTDM